MLTINVKSTKGVFNLSLPTSINEISKSYITDITSNINIDANYTLIGLIFKEKLSTILLAARKNTKKADVAVIPVFAKAGKSDSEFINNLDVRDKLIISPSDIMMGYHISTPNNLLTINNIVDIIDGDPNVYQKCLSMKEECYFIEFKLVPNCNIHGSYNRVKYVDNPYVVKLSDANNDETNTTKSNLIY